MSNRPNFWLFPTPGPFQRRHGPAEHTKRLCYRAGGKRCSNRCLIYSVFNTNGKRRAAVFSEARA